MNEIETFVRADRTLQSVIDRMSDERWDMSLPSDFPTRDDRSYTLSDILVYQAYDEAWIPTMMAGTRIEEAGAETSRAHDLAEVIGVDSDLPDDLVLATWDIVEPNAAEWRQMGVFGPEVDVASDAPLQDRLLGLTGRQP